MSHYDTLGVPTDATADDIKAAYRKQAKAHHPDRESGDEAKMQAVNKAYEVLGDPDKREHYDRTGSDQSTGPSVESTAASFLMHLYQTLCSDEALQRGDIRQNLLNLVAKREGNLLSQQFLAKNSMDKLAKLAKRCSSKDNLLADVIAGRQAGLAQQLEAVEHELEALALLTKDLDLFMDLQPDVPPQAQYQNCQSYNTAQGGLNSLFGFGSAKGNSSW